MVALQTINSIFNYYDAFRREDFPGTREQHDQFLEEEIAKGDDVQLRPKVTALLLYGRPHCGLSSQDKWHIPLTRE